MVPRYAQALCAYVLPAAVIWLGIGATLDALPLGREAFYLLLAYCAYYGALELGGNGALAAPSRRWQVPQVMVVNRSPRRRIIVWGSVLGPGILTQNPYAGFGALLIAVAAIDDLPTGAIVAVGIGVAHGAGRAVALLRGAKRASRSDYLEAVLRSMYWRRVDGAALLILCGLTATSFSTYF